MSMLNLKSNIGVTGFWDILELEETPIYISESDYIALAFDPDTSAEVRCWRCPYCGQYHKAPQARRCIRRARLALKPKRRDWVGDLLREVESEIDIAAAPAA